MNLFKSAFRPGIFAIISLLLFLKPSVLIAAGVGSGGNSIGGIPVEFFLFALILVGVMFFANRLSGLNILTNHN